MQAATQRIMQKPTEPTQAGMLPTPSLSPSPRPAKRRRVELDLGGNPRRAVSVVPGRTEQSSAGRHATGRASSVMPAGRGAEDDEDVAGRMRAMWLGYDERAPQTPTKKNAPPKFTLTGPSTPQATPTRSPSKKMPALPEVDFHAMREGAVDRLLASWVGLEKKWARLEGEDDVIDLRTLDVVEDHGVLQRMRRGRELGGGSPKARGGAETDGETDAGAETDADELDCLQEETPQWDLARRLKASNRFDAENNQDDAADLREFLAAERRMRGEEPEPEPEPPSRKRKYGAADKMEEELLHSVMSHARRWIEEARKTPERGRSQSRPPALVSRSRSRGRSVTFEEEPPLTPSPRKRAQSLSSDDSDALPQKAIPYFRQRDPLDEPLPVVYDTGSSPPSSPPVWDVDESDAEFTDGGTGSEWDSSEDEEEEEEEEKEEEEEREASPTLSDLGMNNEPPLRAPSGHKMEVALARRKPPPVSSPGSSSSDSLPKPPPIRKAKRASVEPESQRKLSSTKASISSPRKSLATKSIVKPPSPGASRVGVGTSRPKPKPVRTKMAAPVDPASSSSSAPPSPVPPPAKSKAQSKPRDASVSPVKETRTESTKRKSSVSPTKSKPLISPPSGSTMTKGATMPPASSPIKSSSKPTPPKPSHSSPTKPKSKTFSFLPSSPARGMSSSPPPEVPAFLFGEDVSAFLFGSDLSFEGGAQKPKSTTKPLTSKFTSKSAPSKPNASPAKLTHRLSSPARRQPVASSSKQTLEDLPPDTSSLGEESEAVDDENKESSEEDELPRPKPPLSRVNGNAASRSNETGLGGGKDENTPWRHTSRPLTPRMNTQIRKPTNTPSRRLTKTPTRQPTVPRSPDHGHEEDGSDSDDPLAVPAQSEQFVVVNGTPAPKPKRLGGGPSATPSRSAGTPARNVGTPLRRAQDGIGTPSRRVDLRFATPTRRVGGSGTPVRSNLAGTPTPLPTPSRIGKRPVGRPRKTPAPAREVIDISSDSE